MEITAFDQKRMSNVMGCMEKKEQAIDVGKHMREDGNTTVLVQRIYWINPAISHSFYVNWRRVQLETKWCVQRH